MYAVIETAASSIEWPRATLCRWKSCGEAGAALEFGTVLAVARFRELLTGAAARRRRSRLDRQQGARQELVFKFKRKNSTRRRSAPAVLTTIKIEEILA